MWRHGGHFENDKETGSGSQRLLELLPIADRVVPSNDRTNNCGAHFGSSSFLARRIGHFHDDNIWPQLPEFISFLVSYSILSIPLRWTTALTGTRDWRILVVVVKVRHLCSCPIGVQNYETAAYLVTKKLQWELNSFLMYKLSIVPRNLHSHWSREWKRSIILFCNLAALKLRRRIEHTK